MKPSLLSDLQDILYRYRWQYAKATVVLIFSNLLLVINPLLLREALNSLEGQSQPPVEGFKAILGQAYSSIWFWTGLLLFIAGISAYCKYLMRIGFISISREAECDLREMLYERIDHQSKLFHDKHPVGDLLSRLTNDISVYRDVLGPGIMYPMYAFTLLIPGLMALFYLSVPMASAALIPIVLLPVVNRLFRGVIYRLSMNVQRLFSSISALVQEHFSGIEIIKCYEIKGYLSVAFDRLGSCLVRNNTRLSVLQGVLYPLFALITKITTLLLVLIAGALILKGWGSLSTADFISFMWLQSYIYIPLLMMGWVLPIYERGKASYDHLLEIYREPIEVKDSGTQDLTIKTDSCIEFNHLTYHYPGSSNIVLQDICLSIPAGQFIGITGPVGSGKSTLFKLLNRDYEIPQGTIAIDGQDIHEYSLVSLHKAFVVVEQLPFLFSKSIAENVSLGSRSATQEQIELASEYADLHETVLAFPDQYSTLVGERGVTLSGGQKQRVVIARALLAGGAIFLFDDIFSAVDAATEHKIFKTIKEQCINKTVLLITHRVSILNQMDRLLVIDEGKLIEDGPPQTLLTRGGYYSALWELQQMTGSEGSK